MTGLVYLDIAIGVIFLILIFSLFAGAILEAIAAIFNLRAGTVREGIKRMIGESEFGDFWKTSLIEGLKGPHTWLSRQFAADQEKRDPSEVSTDVFTKALIQRLRAVLNKREGSLGELVETVRAEAAKDNPSPMVARAAAVLEGVKTDAENAAETIEAALARWYNSTRDRFCGWYVRRTQFILFLTGLGLAMLTNTDPIAYAKLLRDNDDLRQRVVVMAEEVAALEDLEDVRESLGVPTTGPDAKEADRLAAIRKAVNDRTDALADKLKDIKAMGGWTHCKPTDGWGSCFLRTVNPFATDRGIENPVIGWLLLAFAVMLGAQFWLDPLRRFISIRSAGAGLLGANQDQPPQGQTPKPQ